MHVCIIDRPSIDVDLAIIMCTCIIIDLSRSHVGVHTAVVVALR